MKKRLGDLVEWCMIGLMALLLLVVFIQRCG